MTATTERRAELATVTEEMSHRARSYVVQAAVERYGAVGAVRAILEAVKDPDAVLAALAAGAVDVPADRPVITDEMIERGAIAGFDAWNEPGEWNNVAEIARRQYRAIVRAALRAALGPADEATEGGT